MTPIKLRVGFCSVIMLGGIPVLSHTPPSPVQQQTSSAATVATSAPQQQQDGRIRIYIADSESWEISGGWGVSKGSGGGHESGGARPQTAEIIKTFMRGFDSHPRLQSIPKHLVHIASRFVFAHCSGNCSGSLSEASFFPSRLRSEPRKITRMEKRLNRFCVLAQEQDDAVMRIRPTRGRLRRLSRGMQPMRSRTTIYANMLGDARLCKLSSFTDHWDRADSLLTWET